MVSTIQRPATCIGCPNYTSNARCCKQRDVSKVQQETGDKTPMMCNTLLCGNPVDWIRGPGTALERKCHRCFTSSRENPERWTRVTASQEQPVAIPYQDNSEDKENLGLQTPAHYAGTVTPWDLERCMVSSGNAFVDSRRTDAIEYCYRMKGNLLQDLLKAKHCIEAAIQELEKEQA